MNTTVSYWKWQAKKILDLSPEEWARFSGEALATIVTAAMGAKGLDKVSKMSTISREVPMGRAFIAEQSLQPEEMKFVQQFLSDGVLKRELQAEIGPENYIDRWFHWAVFEIPWKEQAVKLPLNQENLETLGKEMSRHDIFQAAFNDVKMTYPEIIAKSGLPSEVVWLRQKAMEYVHTPKRKQIPWRNDVYVMDKVIWSEPVDYFKLIAVLKRDFPDYLKTTKTNLDTMNASSLNQFATKLYKQHGKMRPNLSEISIPIIPEEQANALVDIMRMINKDWVYHGDIHQGNILIGKTAGENGMREIHFIDFDAVWNAKISGSSPMIAGPLSRPDWVEIEHLMEKYPNEPPDVLRLFHTLQNTVIHNQ